MGVSGAYAADPSAGWQNGGWSLQYGEGEGNNRLTLNRETAPLWQHNFTSSRIEVVAELGISYWWTKRAALRGFPRNMWQISATPLVRWWPTDKFYLEAGIGVSLLSERQLKDERYGSNFQFSDQVGIGYQVTKATRIGLRVSHFSNAGMKGPNQGLDQVQVHLATTF